MATICEDQIIITPEKASGVEDARKSATDYIAPTTTSTANDGVKIFPEGEKESPSNYVHIKSDGMHIYSGANEVASYTDNEIELGKNNDECVIRLCDDSGEIGYSEDHLYIGNNTGKMSFGSDAYLGGETPSQPYTTACVSADNTGSSYMPISGEQGNNVGLSAQHRKVVQSGGSYYVDNNNAIVLAAVNGSGSELLIDAEKINIGNTDSELPLPVGTPASDTNFYGDVTFNSGAKVPQNYAITADNEYATKLYVDTHGGGGGTSDHSALSNLAYANSGHTGFQSEISDLSTIRSGATAGSTAVQPEDLPPKEHLFLTNLGSDTNITVTTTKTKGVAPYNPSYYYTNIEVDTTAVGFTEADLYTGLLISIQLASAPTSSYRNVRLRFGSTGTYYPLFYTDVILVGSTYLADTNVVQFLFGTGYVSTGAFHMYYDRNSTYTVQGWGMGLATCDTAEATTAKVATLSNYKLTNGTIVSVKFDYGVPASATLNINSTGAKAIFYNGSAITSGIISANDIAQFVYDGTNFNLVSIDTKATQTGGGGGVTDHSQLTNLSYANSGHTGFQAEISDLADIRSGASLGATAVQPSVLTRYREATEQDYIDAIQDRAINGKADLSHTHTKSDITDFAHNHDDLYYTQNDVDVLLSGKQNTLTAGANITIVNDVISATGGGGGTTNHAQLTNLDYANSGHTGFQPTISDLATIRSGASAGATAVQPNSLATVATSGSYNDLSDKPSIPAAFQFPIGYVFEWSGSNISGAPDLTDATKVATYFGYGTWELFGTGRVTVGKDSGTFATDGATGGSADATLVSHNHTVNGGAVTSGITGGSHNHGFKISTSKIASTTGSLSRMNSSGSATNDLITSETHTHNLPSHTHTVSTEGSSATNANLQPYIVVYRYRRIA